MRAIAIGGSPTGLGEHSSDPGRENVDGIKQPLQKRLCILRRVSPSTQSQATRGLSRQHHEVRSLTQTCT